MRSIPFKNRHTYTQPIFSQASEFCIRGIDHLIGLVPLCLLMLTWLILMLM